MASEVEVLFEKRLRALETRQKLLEAALIEARRSHLLAADPRPRLRLVETEADRG